MLDQQISTPTLFNSGFNTQPTSANKYCRLKPSKMDQGSSGYPPPPPSPFYQLDGLNEFISFVRSMAATVDHATLNQLLPRHIESFMSERAFRFPPNDLQLRAQFHLFVIQSISFPTTPYLQPNSRNALSDAPVGYNQQQQQQQQSQQQQQQQQQSQQSPFFNNQANQLYLPTPPPPHSFLFSKLLAISSLFTSSRLTSFSLDICPSRSMVVVFSLVFKLQVDNNSSTSRGSSSLCSLCSPLLL